MLVYARMSLYRASSLSESRSAIVAADCRPGTVGEVAAVRIRVDGQDPVTAHLAQRRAEGDGHGGLADAALEPEDPDLVRVPCISTDPGMQIHLVQLVGRQAQVDARQQVQQCRQPRCEGILTADFTPTCESASMAR